MDKSSRHILKNNEIIIKHLKESRLFNHLPDEIFQQLIPLSNVASFTAGSTILSEEKENDSVYFLMSGCVSVHSGGEEILQLKRIGDMFGEMSVISQKPTMASVFAMTDIELFSIKASSIGKNTDVDGDNLQNIFYRLFATILTDKLALTTAKARRFEAVNNDLQIMQKQLVRAKDNAEAANLSKSTFLANMSHEVRTPMNGIMGITGLLLESPLSNKQFELTAIIDKSAKSLLKILNDILDYSKIEAGELSIESTCFDLNDTLKEIFDIISISANEKDLNAYFNVDKEIPNLIIGDPLRLRQILLNLLSNAIKFTEKGEVSVNIVIEYQSTSKIKLKFSVKDSGIGISDNQFEHLFESFSQVDASSTRKYGGTGLGLAIANQLVKMMGGDIAVESELGKGSEFWFTLMFDKQEDRRTDTHSSEYSDWNPSRSDDVMLNIPEVIKKSVKILLVEDDKVNQMVALFTLKRLGFNIDAVDNGLECIKALEEIDYNIIFMDVQMPELDGFEATQVIRDKKSKVKNHNIPIVAMTAHAMKGDKERCLEVGMDDYISKPIEHNQLNIILNRWLASSDIKQENTTESENLETIIDFDIYSTLEDNIGDISYVMKAFISDLPQKINDIKQAIFDDNPLQLEHKSHPLKANCRTLGIIKLGDLCETLEYLGNVGKLDKARELLEEFDLESKKVLRILINNN